MDIRSRVGVVGAGTMGNGIAHVFARAGFEVVLYDLSEALVERGMGIIAGNLGREIAKGKITEVMAQDALGRIAAVSEFRALEGMALVVEAATERFAVKAELFRALDCMLDAEAVLASNTSAISITRLGGQTKRAGKVIGMHFFNPVPVMELVEVVRGLETTDHTVQTVKELATTLGKTAVEVRDAAGFVSNRVLMPMINEAVFAVMEGVATAEAIDAVFVLGMAHKMGPLRLADFIGLDVCLDILRVLQEGFGDPKYRPCPLLVRMVDAGWMGRKSGRGFYIYDER